MRTWWTIRQVRPAGRYRRRRHSVPTASSQQDWSEHPHGSHFPLKHFDDGAVLRLAHGNRMIGSQSFCAEAEERAPGSIAAGRPLYRAWAYKRR